MPININQFQKIILLIVMILFALLYSSDFALAVLPTKCSDTVDSSDCPAGQKCVKQEIIPGRPENRCARALEIVYPTIPGQPAPITIAEGIPQYFKYIFNLAVALIGLVVFGVFVYHGTLYLSSAGNVSKLADAKQGISTSLLGAAILLSAYIIFATINPQLTILTLNPVALLEQAVSPGVYVCNYKYTGNSVTTKSVENLISEYISKEEEEQIEVVKEFQSLILNPDAKDEKCFKVNFSGNFQNLVVEENDTMFVIPSVRDQYNDAIKNYERKPLYEYGLILHEKDDYGGKCAIYPILMGSEISAQVYTTTTKNSEGRIIIGDEPYPNTYKNPVPLFEPGPALDYFGNKSARSITVFKKPAETTFADAKGLIMHMCLDSDKSGVCPTDLSDTFVDPNTLEPKYTTGEPPFLPPANAPLDALLVGLVAPDVNPKTGGGIRSVKIDPRNLVFAVLMDLENFDDIKLKDPWNCAVIKQNDPDISNIGLRKCDAGVGVVGACDKKGWFNWFYAPITGKCVPCIANVAVIKGQVL